MNLPRIFANAVARRVAFVVVAAFCALIAQCFNQAQAAQCGIPSQAEAAAAAGASLTYEYEGEARSACLSMVRWHGAVSGGIAPEVVGYECAATGPSGRQFIRRAEGTTRYRSSCTSYEGSNYTASQTGWAWTKAGCPPGEGQNADGTCDSCSGRSPLGAGAWTGVNSDMQMCQDGCTFEGGIGGGVGVCLPVVIDGTTYQHCTSWGPTGDQCSAGVGNGSLAPPDSDGDGSSDGNDPSPNNPGSGGSGSDGNPGEDGSSACGGPDQPPCESDGSNSGSGKGNTSGGGGNCQTPPSSTGDAILAQIAYQTWATRCAVEGQGQGGTGTGPGDGAKEGTLKGIKDFLDGNGQSLDEPADPWMDGDGITESDWNMGLGGGSCPAPVSTTISLAGVSQSIDFSFQPLCDLAGLLNVLFMALGAFIAAYIIAGVRR